MNVTSGQVALGIQLHWRPGIPLILSLGSGFHPNITNYNAQIRLPPAAAPEGSSGQGLSPELLRGGCDPLQK